MFEQLYIDNEDEMMKLIMLRLMKGKTSPLSLITEQGKVYPLYKRIGLKAQCLALKIPMF